LTYSIIYIIIYLDVSLCLRKEHREYTDGGILGKGGTNMETVSIVCIVGLVTITYLVMQKKVRKHIIEVSFGKIFQFKTETEFSKEA